MQTQHGMSQEDATALFHMRCVWGDRYVISFSNGTWRAGRVGTSADFTLLAKSAEELRNLIGVDYAHWQQEGRRHNQ